jgi:lysophospholipase L1-like esterase
LINLAWFRRRAGARQRHQGGAGIAAARGRRQEERRRQARGAHRRPPPETLRQLNAWIAAYAGKNRYVFLDYHKAVADGEGRLRPDLTDDGLHPNAAGYAVMARLAQAAIAAALRR